MTCYLNAVGVISALGAGVSNSAHSLSKPESENLVFSNQFDTKGRIRPMGIVELELPDQNQFPVMHRTHNNQLLIAALNQMTSQVDAAIQRFGKDRVAVILGTSTSGIAEAEQAVRTFEEDGAWPEDFDYAKQDIGAPSLFLAEHLNLYGIAYTISTACSSGAKALASGKRLLEANLCDAAIVGGVDSLCGLTVNGFSSLNALSSNVCNPFSKNRRGINIGEGAGLFLMTKEVGPVKLVGVGETSDAHHISAPDPTGDGAYRSMEMALHQAELTPEDIDYINLHGTATTQNDLMESKAVFGLFGNNVPCSSTKPFTGHCLGASGSIEAVLCWMLLQPDLFRGLPVHQWDGEIDDDISPIKLVDSRISEQCTGKIHRILSNSFAFGGNNVSLIFEVVPKEEVKRECE